MPPSIFQQIVLPYLAHRSIPNSRYLARFISSSIARSRAPSNTDSSSSSSLDSTTRAWEYVPPIAPVPFDPGHDPPGESTTSAIPWRARHTSASANRGGPGGEALVFLRSLEDVKGGRRETLLLALERLASISGSGEEDGNGDVASPAERDVDGPAKKQHAETTPSGSKTAVTDVSDETLTLPITLDQSLTTSPSIEDKPLLDPKLYPHIIYTLLRARLYRLAVYHLLQTPEFAVDQPLLDRVAEWMRGNGAGKLARRLERGWDGTYIYKDTPLPHLPYGSAKLPDSAWLISRRAAARPPPLPDASTLASLTANYNSHLTRALFSPKKNSSSPAHNNHSSNPLTPLNNLLTNSQPLQRPSGGMRQLRQLLKKIARLESHRRFRPDWVTANLVVKCWMNCLMSGGQGWKAGRLGEEDIDKRIELRGLFAFVKVLFEKEVQDRAEGNKPTLDSDTSQSDQTSQSYPYPLTLSYTRHIRPFASDLIRASRQIEDKKGIQQILEWQKEMRDKMEDMGEEKHGKSKLYPRRRRSIGT